MQSGRVTGNPELNFLIADDPSGNGGTFGSSNLRRTGSGSQKSVLVGLCSRCARMPFSSSSFFGLYHTC